MPDPTGDIPAPQATTVADPHLVGFRGEQFDFMGSPGRWFALLSDPDLQVNTKILGVPGLEEVTFNGQLAIRSGPDRILVTRHYDRHGPLAYCNGRRVVACSGPVRLERRDLVLETPHYLLRATRVLYRDWIGDVLNCTPHLNLAVSLGPEWSRELEPHGVLGQTARPGDRRGLPDSRQGEGVIEGHWSDYEVSGPWRADFRYNRLAGHGTDPQFLRPLGPVSPVLVA